MKRLLAVFEAALVLMAFQGAVLSVHPTTRPVGLVMLVMGLCGCGATWVSRRF